MVLDVAQKQGIDLRVLRADEKRSVPGELDVGEWPGVQRLQVVVSINQARRLVHDGLVFNLEGLSDMKQLVDHFCATHSLNMRLFRH